MIAERAIAIDHQRAEKVHVCVSRLVLLSLATKSQKKVIGQGSLGW
jgi:hypothetical protein